MQLKFPLLNSPVEPNPDEGITSAISPCAARAAYTLGKYAVFPTYFSKIEIVGRENIPRTGAVIVAPTHRARWDSIIVPHAVGYFTSKRHLHFMVSANEMRGIQGWLIRRLGGFPVDTEQPGIGSFRHAVNLLVKGEMVTIFPQGGVFRDNQIGTLKPGLARIACHAQLKISQQQEGVKILPISIRYSQPEPKFRSEVKVKIGEPLEVAEFNFKKSVKAATQNLHLALENALQTLEERNPPLFVG